MPVWDTFDEVTQHDFLCRLLPWEDKLVAVQTDIGRVWDPKYHYHLDLTSTVPIGAKLPHLCPEEEAWLDIHLDELVSQGSYWLNFTRGAATMCYTVAPSAGHLVWAALLSMPKNCPSQ